MMKSFCGEFGRLKVWTRPWVASFNDDASFEIQSLLFKNDYSRISKSRLFRKIQGIFSERRTEICRVLSRTTFHRGLLLFKPGQASLFSFGWSLLRIFGHPSD